MAKYERRSREEDRGQSWDAGTCRACGKIHRYRCAVDGCSRPGTITDSINHACAGSARWVCAHHYRGGR